MYGMISSDASRLAVSRHDPYTQFGPARLKSGRNGGCPSMYGMHAVSIHIIGKPAVAANARNDHDILTGNAHLGHYFLNLGQNGVVSAARAPANFLVGHKILGCERYGHPGGSVHCLRIFAKYDSMCGKRFTGTFSAYNYS